MARRQRGVERDGKEEEEEERARAVRLRRLVQFTPGGFPPVSFALCLSQKGGGGVVSRGERAAFVPPEKFHGRK